MIIAIDGPSGAGKSTLGRRIARELGFVYIDTGAMYRAVALAVMQECVRAEDTQKIAAIASRARIALEEGSGDSQVRLNGRDVSAAVRAGKVGQFASVISVIPEVRRELVLRQRETALRAKEGAVLDGRDIGTVVFPDADVKFFLTATPDQRAHRRFREETLREEDLSFEETLDEISTRDSRDSTRADSPLSIADGAIVIDSSELSIEEVFERMMDAIREAEKGRGEKKD